MLATTAIYFDGLSSTPQEVELKFDEDFKVFSFQSSSSIANQWDVKDCIFEYNKNSLAIRYGNEAAQNLKINDTVFVGNVKAFLKKNGHVSWYQRLLDLSLLSHFLIAIGLLGFIITGYFTVIPWVAEKAVVIIPENYDDKLGTTVYEQYVRLSDIDTVKTNAVNKFAKKLRLNNFKNIHFTVVESETVNAFALPDGNVVIYTGIIDLMKDYDELAGLIGHEVAHVNERHSMKMMCKNLSGYLFISAMLGDVNGVMAVIADNANSLQSLSYSRKFEQEADYKGLEILAENNVNPEGMVNLFKRLQSKGDNYVPEFLSSHPVTADRISYIKKAIEAKKYVYLKDNELSDLFNVIKK